MKILTSLISMDSTPTPKFKPPRMDKRTQPESNDFTPDQEFKMPRTKELTPPTASSDEYKQILSRYSRSSKASVDPISKDGKWVGFSPKNWIFSQATAIVSVNLEEDGHTVTQDTIPYINGNFNAFASELIAKYYKSFIGAHNYKNHEQVPSKSYGIVIDAALRQVQVPDTESHVYYVDLLIATNKHKDLEWATSIQDRIVKFLSMGCESSSLTCSKCGAVSFSEEDDCKHLRYDLGMNYLDSMGNRNPVVSLVTDEQSEEMKESGEEGFIEFIEISYLDVPPAFGSCVSSHILEAEDTVWVQFPRSAMKREAFQVWKNQIEIQ